MASSTISRHPNVIKPGNRGKTGLTAMTGTAISRCLDMGGRLGRRHHTFKALPRVAGRTRRAGRRVVHAPDTEGRRADVAAVAGLAGNHADVRNLIQHQQRRCFPAGRVALVTGTRCAAEDAFDVTGFTAGRGMQTIQPETSLVVIEIQRLTDTGRRWRRRLAGSQGCGEQGRQQEKRDGTKRLHFRRSEQDD